MNNFEYHVTISKRNGTICFIELKEFVMGHNNTFVLEINPISNWNLEVFEQLLLDEFQILSMIQKLQLGSLCNDS